MDSLEKYRKYIMSGMSKCKNMLTGQ